MKATNLAHWKEKKRVAESRHKPILTDDEFFGRLDRIFGRMPAKNNETKKPPMANHRKRG